MKDQKQIISNLESKLLTKDEENSSLKLTIKSLTQEIELLKAVIYGKKSEKLSASEVEDTKQLILPNLFNELESKLDTSESSSSKDEDITLPSSKPKKKVGRKALPKDLPRKQVIHDLSESEKKCHCGKEMCKIGEEVSEQLDYVPAKLQVLEHIRYKYACRHCYENVQIASSGVNVISNGIASSGLISHTITSKFEDHIPFYRQSQMWGRVGIEIPDATLCNWNYKSSLLLEMLVDMLISDIISSNYACSDETPLNVLLSSNSTNYMWVHHSGSRLKRAVVFDYHETRKGECASGFLSGFTGIHQCDGYSGYDRLYKNNKILRAGCMDHARRKFFDVYKLSDKKPGFAKDILTEIKLLYKVEAEITKYSYPPDKILELRQKISKVVFKRLKDKLLNNKDAVPPQTTLGKAIHYMLNQWESLALYLDHPHIRISNADAERIIKPFTIGRKNWLFNKTKSGAKASAVIYSIIETCKANNINSYQYLRYVLPLLKKSKADPDFKIDKSILPYNINTELLKL